MISCGSRELEEVHREEVLLHNKLGYGLLEWIFSLLKASREKLVGSTSYCAEAGSSLFSPEIEAEMLDLYVQIDHSRDFLEGFP